MATLAIASSYCRTYMHAVYITLYGSTNSYSFTVISKIDVTNQKVPRNTKVLGTS